jgi:Sec-independent protein secretion pathway component TatC
VFLQAPLAEILNAKGGGRMIFTALHEGFFTQIKVGFFTALCITFPIISMQLWKFVAPGLYKNERNAFLTVFDCHTSAVYPWCGDGLLCRHANGMGVLRVI